VTVTCFVLFTPLLSSFNIMMLDFTRLKLVQGKKQEEQKREKIAHDKEVAAGKKVIKETNEADITAEFDAADDADVVF